MATSDRPTVFVSHSQHDEEGQLFLLHVFSLPESQFRPHFYSIKPVKPHAKSIRDWIRRSEALFFLLSEKMVDPKNSDYTRAWVGYEVGIASERGLPVVVIEPRGRTVNLPVPGATHYLRRPLAAQESLGKEWIEVASTACSFSGPIEQGPPIKGLTIPRRKGDPAPGEVVGYVRLDTLDIIDNLPFMRLTEGDGLFHRIVCPDARCRATFLVPDSIYGWDESYPCPTCRFVIPNPHAAKL